MDQIQKNIAIDLRGSVMRDVYYFRILQVAGPITRRTSLFEDLWVDNPIDQIMQQLRINAKVTK